jgi:HAMP domain-containing protein
MLLTGIGAGTFYAYSVINLRIDTVHSLDTTIRSRAGHIETYLASMKGRMADFSSDGLISECLYTINAGTAGCLPDQLSQHLRVNKLPVVKELDRVAVVDMRGKIIASTLESEIGTDMSGEEFFTNARSVPMIFEPTDVTDDSIVYTVTSPILFQKEFQGFIVASYIPDKLYSILADRTGLGKTGETYLVNTEGLMASPSAYFSSLAYHQRINTESSQDCFSGVSVAQEDSDADNSQFQIIHEYTNYRNIDVFGVHAYIDSMKWCVLAEIEKTETSSTSSELGWFLTFLSLGIDLAVFIIAFVLGKKISAPIIALERGAEIIAKGHLEHRVGTKSPDEIGALSRTFDKMTDAIRHSHVRITPHPEDTHEPQDTKSER